MSKRRSYRTDYKLISLEHWKKLSRIYIDGFEIIHRHNQSHAAGVSNNKCMNNAVLSVQQYWFKRDCRMMLEDIAVFVPTGRGFHGV